MGFRCESAFAKNAQLFICCSMLNKAVIPKNILKIMIYTIKSFLFVWSYGFIHDDGDNMCVPHRLNIYTLRELLSEKITIPFLTKILNICIYKILLIVWL